MKSLLSAVSVFVVSQILVSSAWADLNCEKKHQAALKNLISVSQTVSDPKIKSILLDGKDSGISLLSLDREVAKNAMQAKTGKINQILGSLTCKSNDGVLEAVKRAFKKKEFETAARLVNSSRGLRGMLKKQTDLIAGMAETPTAPEETLMADADPAAPEVDNGDGEGADEVTRPQLQLASYTPTQTRKQYPVRVASDGLWIVDTEHPVIPKKGSFRIDYASLPAARECKNLTRAQWQQVALGRANCESGSYQKII